MLSIPDVSIYKTSALDYPAKSPFNPSQDYPEYPFDRVSLIDSSNQVYDAVRQSLFLLGCDREQYNCSSWNPLKSIINSGETVLVKPNAVMHLNMKQNDSVFASITHGSVIRAVIDYIYIALQGKGKIIIADAPLAHSDFEQWLRITGVKKIIELYQKEKAFKIEVHDLRNLYVPWDFEYGYSPSESRSRVIRDPDGYVEVDLKSLSEFSSFTDKDIRLLYGSDYDRHNTVQYHLNGHHKYYVSQTVLNADVFVSLPKLKVHSKVGVTINLKGMVGTQGDKNYIPHHRIGHPAIGGDEYPDLGLLQNTLNRYRMWLLTRVLVHQDKVADFIYRRLVFFQHIGQRILDKIGRIKYGKNYKGNIIGGSWYGNDTAWRMTLDLTRIVLYSNKEGNICASPQRKFFSVVDGIIGGEGEGPLSPTAKNAGVILAGFNPLAVDIVATRLMGFDYRKIKMLEQGIRKSWLKQWQGEVSEIQIFSNQFYNSSILDDISDSLLSFLPSIGWQKYVEIGVNMNE